jgi:hypothetical protein
LNKLSDPELKNKEPSIRVKRVDSSYDCKEGSEGANARLNVLKRIDNN